MRVDATWLLPTVGLAAAGLAAVGLAAGLVLLGAVAWDGLLAPQADSTRTPDTTSETEIRDLFKLEPRKSKIGHLLLRMVPHLRAARHPSRRRLLAVGLI
jgi:hypothetical protein